MDRPIALIVVMVSRCVHSQTQQTVYIKHVQISVQQLNLNRVI